jgi:hypothetical protein
LPPVVPRNRIEKYLGGVISRGYLQNLDAEAGDRRLSGAGKKSPIFGKTLCYGLKSGQPQRGKPMSEADLDRAIERWRIFEEMMDWPDS